jgi:hypothetical protein
MVIMIRYLTFIIENRIQETNYSRTTTTRLSEREKIRIRKTDVKKMTIGIKAEIERQTYTDELGRLRTKKHQLVTYKG